MMFLKFIFCYAVSVLFIGNLYASNAVEEEALFDSIEKHFNENPVNEVLIDDDQVKFFDGKRSKGASQDVIDNKPDIKKDLLKDGVIDEEIKFGDIAVAPDLESGIASIGNDHIGANDGQLRIPDAAEFDMIPQTRARLQQMEETTPESTSIAPIESGNKDGVVGFNIDENKTVSGPDNAKQMQQNKPMQTEISIKEGRIQNNAIQNSKPGVQNRAAISPVKQKSPNITNTAAEKINATKNKVINKDIKSQQRVADVQKPVAGKIQNAEKTQITKQPQVSTEPLQAQRKSTESRIVDIDINKRKVFSSIQKSMDQKFETKRELNEHIPLNTYPHEYSQLLFVAAARGDIGGIKALLDMNADMNAQDGKNGNTPLMYATANGKISAMQYLISRGAQVNITTYNGKNALHIAAMAGNIDAFLVLMSAGCDLSAVDTNAMRPFDYVASDRESFASRVIPADFSINDVLMSCTIMNMPVCFKGAMQKGANINYQDYDGNTPLMIAIRHGLVDLIRLIFEYGPNTKIRNRSGDTIYGLAKNIGDDLIYNLVFVLAKGQDNLPKGQAINTPIPLVTKN